jgi:class 3 adenylate cyclase
MRRRLTTLFVDIAGSTRLVVRHPPETMLGVVQCFAELVTGIALRHRGRVKDFDRMSQHQRPPAPPAPLVAPVPVT